MSIQIDTNVESDGKKLMNLLAIIEKDDRYKTVLAAAADAKRDLFKSLQEKTTTSNEIGVKCTPKKRRKLESGWDTGHNFNIELQTKQHDLAKSIVSSVEKYIEIRSLALKHTASSLSSGNTDLTNRIYVGSLDYTLNESYVTELFQKFGEIVSITMPKDASNPSLSCGYCFVEFKHKESVSTAKEAMHGYIINGRPIKVSQPANNITDDGASASRTTQMSDLLGPQKNSRLFFSNVPLEFTNEDMKAIFQVFGPLRGVQMIKNHQNNDHNGSGLLEYYEIDDARVALASSANLQINMRNLHVKPATDADENLLKGGDVNRVQLQSAINAIALISSKYTTKLSIVDSNKLADAQVDSQADRIQLSRKLDANRNQDKIVLMLENVITHEDVANATAEDMQELDQEIRHKCSQFGNILGIKFDTQNMIVYVKYMTSFESVTAKEELQNIPFDGRNVRAEITNYFPDY